MTTTATPAPPTPTPTRKRRRPWGLITMSVATLGLLVFMLWAYIPPDIANSRADMHGDRLRFALLMGHITFGTIATVAGLLQFWPVLRAKHPRLHRWTGRAYFYLGIFPAAVLAVPVVVLSEQGVSNQAALLLMAILWAATGIAGLRATLQRRYRDHRRWMIRNYAITLAIFASRLWGGPLFAIVFAMEDTRVYQGNEMAMIHDIASAGAWLSLMVNMLVAEAIIHRKKKARR